MNKEKQIEEMARACCWGGARDGKSCEECLNDSILKLKGCECEWKTRVAKALYNAGYHKQSEGEWEKRNFIILDFEKTGYRCSACGTTWDAPTKFCPYCGAKMKGE